MTRKASVVRVFNEKGEKVKAQSYWLGKVSKWYYFHDEMGEAEAEFQAGCALDYREGEFARPLTELPEGWFVSVTHEDIGTPESTGSSFN